jgi:hypothetical protein
MHPVVRALINPGKSSPDNALYWLGDECVDVTGGWTQYYSGQAPNILTKNVDSLYLRSYGATSDNASKSPVAFSTANKIDLTNYTTLKAYITTHNSTKPSGSAYAMFGVDPALGTYLIADFDVRAVNGITGSGTGTNIELSIDVSTVNQEMYIIIYETVNSSAAAIYSESTWTKIWYE